MIVVVDAVPFRSWYESHYAMPLARKKGQKLSPEEEEKFNAYKAQSKKTQHKYTERQKTATVEPHLMEQFQTGRLYACVSSRPGQSGKADGYILEGKELDFYLRKIKAKKSGR
jgi:small subunit ribosomal protein S8e